MPERLLTIRNLVIEGFADEHWYPIVQGIDLYVDRGEVLGLIGESGAGKSTLGLAALCYSRNGCRIVDGSIVFDGLALHTLAEDAVRKLRGARIAYVAQSAAASFNPAHRILAQCTEPPIQHGLLSAVDAEGQARDLYAQLALSEPETIGNRYPHQVSGGQLQRAMVAMAMACQPDLIIFDEPTTALDVTTQVEVLAALKNMISLHNTAAIYISHDLAVVAQLADRIMVLRHGHLIEEGRAEDILTQPQEDYTRHLVSLWRRQESAEARRNAPVVLQCQNIAASYVPGTRVVEEMSFTLQRGKTVAVVGESGSGKSTLARVVTGVLPALEGLVIFDGQTIPASYTQRSRETLRRMQLIYQMPDVALNPRHTIRQVLGRPLAFYFGVKGREQEKRIAELLEMVQLPAAFANRYTTQLSGGQQQRVCIARALAAQPDIIICDEVTSALDPLAAEGILELLERLQDTLGVAYLFITHDLTLVKAIADEILVMYQGKIIEQGPAQEVLIPPHHAYTERLLSSVPALDTGWLDTLLAKRPEPE